MGIEGNTMIDIMVGLKVLGVIVFLCVVIPVTVQTIRWRILLKWNVDFHYLPGSLHPDRIVVYYKNVKIWWYYWIHGEDAYKGSKTYKLHQRWIKEANESD